MERPKIYLGIYSQGMLPLSACDTEFSHTERHAGREVQYFHCWKYDENASRPAFPDDKLRKDKINQIDKQLGVKLDFKKIRREHRQRMKKK